MGLADYFDPENVRMVDKHCKGCVYLARVGGTVCCDYIGPNEHSRPCPAGKGCTEKKAGRKRAQPCVG